MQQDTGKSRTFNAGLTELVERQRGEYSQFNFEMCTRGSASYPALSTPYSTINGQKSTS